MVVIGQFIVIRLVAGGGGGGEANPSFFLGALIEKSKIGLPRFL